MVGVINNGAPGGSVIFSQQPYSRKFSNGLQRWYHEYSRERIINQSILITALIVNYILLNLV